MPTQPPNHRPPGGPNDGPKNKDEIRAIYDERARRKKKKQQQKLLLLGAFVLAAVLLVVCLVMIFKALFPDKDKKDPSTGPSSSFSFSASIPDPAPLRPHAADPNVWNLKIINAQNPVGPDFKPEVVVFTPVGNYFDARAVDQLKQMIADCNAVEGHSLGVISGYRSFEYQTKEFQKLVTEFRKQGMSAELAEAETLAVYDRPGTTEHHTGLAVDFKTTTVASASEAFASTAEFGWLVENAANYGFILRYAAEKESITGYGYKPWHWRYVGVEDAALIRDAGLCLEEYVTPPDTAPPPDTTPEDLSGSGSAAGG